MIKNFEIAPVQTGVIIGGGKSDDCVVPGAIWLIRKSVSVLVMDDAIVLLSRLMVLTRTEWEKQAAVRPFVVP